MYNTNERNVCVWTYVNIWLIMPVLQIVFTLFWLLFFSLSVCKWKVKPFFSKGTTTIKQSIVKSSKWNLNRSWCSRFFPTKGTDSSMHASPEFFKLKGQSLQFLPLLITISTITLYIEWTLKKKNSLKFATCLMAQRF